MFQLRSPILRKYWSRDGFCVINQPFGYNDIGFYKELGTKGHTGIDFKTQGAYQFTTSKLLGFLWKRSKEKTGGLIEIQATHSGFLTVEKNFDRISGIKMKIESEPMEENGKTVKYETLYFHLDRCSWVKTMV